LPTMAWVVAVGGCKVKLYKCIVKIVRKFPNEWDMEPNLKDGVMNFEHRNLELLGVVDRC
jgi:hypothetical protein